MTRVRDPAAFLDAVGPLLLEDEARHNVLLGIAWTLRDRPGYHEEFHLWRVQAAGRVVGAAVMTPPFNLVVARPAVEGALEALVDHIRDEALALPGISAPLPEADAFADAWETRAQVERRQRRALRIYRLTRVLPVTGVQGRARWATQEDRPLLVAWVEAFAREAIGEEPSTASDAERIVDARLGDDILGLMLWEDGEPVSLAGAAAPTPNGVRIGPVYTPPERRRRGYGTAVTAALSQEQLTSGRRFCCLYTDLTNPTSNAIYANIGYEPVCDAVEYEFVPTA